MAVYSASCERLGLADLAVGVRVPVDDHAFMQIPLPQADEVVHRLRVERRLEDEQVAVDGVAVMIDWFGDGVHVAVKHVSRSFALFAVSILVTPVYASVYRSNCQPPMVTVLASAVNKLIEADAFEHVLRIVAALPLTVR